MQSILKLRVCNKTQQNIHKRSNYAAAIGVPTMVESSSLEKSGWRRPKLRVLRSLVLNISTTSDLLSIVYARQRNHSFLPIASYGFIRFGV
jgi:hypothetical protein